MIYGLMSDQHFHLWSAFASTDAEGRNTRLMQALHEVDRLCEAVLAAGGEWVVLAGDAFHVRGSVSPLVFNPVADCFRRWRDRGLRFQGIPGNHDLASRDSNRLSSAVEMLAQAADMIVHHAPHAAVGQPFAFVPWIPKHAELLQVIEQMAEGDDPSGKDLFLHAGIDGVLTGMPDHGLTAAKLASFGFRRVWAGHYHHAVELGGGVFSIGSPCQQTWSDVGTKSGWWLVSDDKVTWHASHAPKFIDITAEMDPDEIPFLVDGHYVRARIGRATAAAVAQWREDLVEMGAQGVLIQSTPASAPVRVGSLASGLASLPATVTAWCAEQGMGVEVATLCHGILGELAA